MLLTNKFRNSKRDKDNFKIHVVIVAAGLGTRFGLNYPKQFCRFNGEYLIKKSVDLFLGLDYIDKVECVIPELYYNQYMDIFYSENSSKLLPPVIGGASRQESVKNGLNSISKYFPDFVLVHDAVRCFCSQDLIKNVVIALTQGHKAVVPAISPTDSIRLNGKNVNRNEVKLIQTPQGFDYKLIRDLHNKYENLAFSDEAGLCDRAQIEVKLIDGEVTNKKITYKSDICESYVRTGLGYDAHRFSADSRRKLCLMGLEIPNYPGLEGVSDADVGIHSLVDAILGSLGEGSIGEHFPPKEFKLKEKAFRDDPNASVNQIDNSYHQEIDSKGFLTYCKNLLSKKQAYIVNIDTTIICEAPSISHFSKQMKSVIANYLNISESDINIKGKTTEGMGFEGRKEGISAQTIVTIKYR